MNVSVNRPSSLTPMPVGGTSRGDQGGVIVVFLVLLFATFLFSANSASGQRSAIAGVVTLLLFPVVWFVPRTGLPAVAFSMMVMGGFRRSLIPLLGYTESDPLLLVSPVVATFCFLNFVIKRQLKPTTQLSKWALVFMALMGLSVLNPLQGGPLVGLTGAAFYLVPMMWYCIGRNFGTPLTIKAIAQTVLVASVLGALYGLKQQYFGFSDAEHQWFELSHFSNQVGATERPMSFYTSPAEYANFLAMGIVICFCRYLRGQKGFVVVALLLAYALLLTGIRGIVFCTVGACLFMWGIQGPTIRGWLPRIIAAAVIVGVGGFFGLQQIGTVASAVGGNDGGAELIHHQVVGLTDPLSEHSSAHGHIGNMMLGFIGGFKMPIGYGLGVSTMGSGRFGGSMSFTAETDIATIFFSMGAIGGIVFIGTIVVTFRAAILYWFHTRSYIPLVLLGMLVVANGNWLTAGNYAESIIIWTLIGCLDRSWNDGKSVPGFTQKMKVSKGSIAIWKRALARRLSGVDPSWEASYRRARGRAAAPAPTADATAALATESASEQTRRLTPSARRALERQQRETLGQRSEGPSRQA